MTAQEFTFWLKGYIAAGGDANSVIVKQELEKVTTPSVYIGSQWHTPVITTTPAIAPTPTIYPTITWTCQDYENKNL